jgi:hypothetical protein
MGGPSSRPTGERAARRAAALVEGTRGLARAARLAAHHARLAVDAVRALPPPPTAGTNTEAVWAARAALIGAARQVLEGASAAGWQGVGSGGGGGGRHHRSGSATTDSR